MQHLHKLKYKIDCFNTVDVFGWNALHHICGNNIVSCLQFIYRIYNNSIDWNIVTKNKWKGTPLMIALIARDSAMKVDCIRFLANLKAIDIASYRSGRKCLNLSKKHATRDKQFIFAPPMTALECSCYYGCEIRIVKILKH